MSSESSMKCTICSKISITLYHFWQFDLCPKCHGKFRDVEIPSYIPNEHNFRYKINVVKKIYGKV